MASAFLDTLKQITTGDATFAALSDPTLESWIALAVVELSTSAWGSLYVQAGAYLAAHKYMMGPGLSALSGSAGGAVVERRARNWSVRYGETQGASTGDKSYMETSYGREFLRLRALTKRPNLATPSTT